MMKFSKTLLLVIGVVGVIAFLGLTVYNVIEINQLHAVANANRSATFPNPRNFVLIANAVGLVGGFLLGVGLVMPDKSFAHRYAEQRKTEAVSEARDAGYAGSSVVNRDTLTVDPKPENL